MHSGLKLYASALALCVLVAASAPASAQDGHRFVAETPTARQDYWQQRAAEIDAQLSGAQSLESVRLVFVGDSITDFWHLDANPWFPGKYCGRAIWDETFGGAIPALKGLNLGVSGDRIEHVLHRLQPRSEGGEGWLDRPDLQPDTVVLLVGINNSFDSESPATESIYKGILAVIARIQERRPSARIVLQSLLPTDDPAKNRDLVTVINRKLADYAGQAHGVQYLDLYSSFVDGQGNQRRELFNDGLHPSRSGYAIWRDRLVQALAAPR